MSDPARAAYAAGLAMLSRRDLSEALLRERLVLKEHSPDAVEAALARLRSMGAVDDRRVALAAARAEVEVRLRGRSRVYRRLQALGIPPDLAEEALDEVFSAVDEAAMVERALEKRLRRSGGRISGQAQVRRLFQQLVRQGFQPSQVVRALKARAKSESVSDDEP